MALNNNKGRPALDRTAIVDELKRRYPNGSEFTSADDLFAANPDLLPKLKTLKNTAKESFGMPLGKYLKSIGLIGNKEARTIPIETRKQKLFIKLTEAYPNKIIYRLKQDNYTLYKTASELAEAEGIGNIEEFLLQNGFSFKKGESISMQEYVDILKARYSKEGALSMKALKEENTDIPFSKLEKWVKETHQKSLLDYMYELKIVRRMEDIHKEKIDALIKQFEEDNGGMPQEARETFDRYRADNPSFSVFKKHVYQSTYFNWHYSNWLIKRGLIQGSEADYATHCVVKVDYFGTHQYYKTNNCDIKIGNFVIVGDDAFKVLEVFIAKGYDLPINIERCASTTREVSAEEYALLSQGKDIRKKNVLPTETYKTERVELELIEEKAEFKTIVKPGYWTPTFTKAIFKGLRFQIEEAAYFAKTKKYFYADIAATSTPDLCTLYVNNVYDGYAQGVNIVDQIMKKFPELKMVAFFDDVRNGYVCYSAPGYGYVTHNQYISFLDHHEEELYPEWADPTCDFKTTVSNHISDYKEYVNYKFPFKREWNSYDYLVKKNDGFYCITTIKLPTNTVLELEDYAYSGSHSLKKIIFPSKCAIKVSPLAFVGSNHIESFEFEGDNASLTTLDGTLVNVNHNEVILTYQNDKIPSYPLVRSLGEFSYAGKSISEIFIPSNIQVIKKNAFKNCKKLKKIVFEGAVPQIASDAFEGCSSIKIISAPNGSIENCNLTGLEHAILKGFFELITEGNTLEDHVIQGGNNYIRKHPNSLEGVEDNLPVLTYLLQNKLLSQQMAEDIIDKAWLLDNHKVVALLQDYLSFEGNTEKK